MLKDSFGYIRIYIQRYMLIIYSQMFPHIIVTLHCVVVILDCFSQRYCVIITVLLYTAFM